MPTIPQTDATMEKLEALAPVLSAEISTVPVPAQTPLPPHARAYKEALMTMRVLVEKLCVARIFCSSHPESQVRCTSCDDIQTAPESLAARAVAKQTVGGNLTSYRPWRRWSWPDTKSRAIKRLRALLNCLLVPGSRCKHIPVEMQVRMRQEQLTLPIKSPVLGRPVRPVVEQSEITDCLHNSLASVNGGISRADLWICWRHQFCHKHLARRHLGSVRKRPVLCPVRRQHVVNIEIPERRSNGLLRALCAKPVFELYKNRAHFRRVQRFRI
jgi:hypothetical protein